METVTTVLLIAGFAAIGIYLFIKGVRGAIRSWKEELKDGL